MLLDLGNFYCNVLLFSKINSTSTLKIMHSFNVARRRVFNLLKPTGYVMYQQFNIQLLYILPTL